MPPLIEAYFTDMASRGRPHLREKADRLDPLVAWCVEHGVDPAQATTDELAAFRAWVLADWRLRDGREPADHTRRHVVGAVRLWYRWLHQAGHRDSDPGADMLRLAHRGPTARARFMHAPLHPRMEAYLAFHQLRGRPGMVAAVGLALRQFNQWCGEHHIDAMRLTRAQGEAYLAWLSTSATTPSGQHLARTTIAQRVACLVGFYEWLEARGEIIASPVAKLRVRVVESRVVVHQHLSLQEATAVVQAQASHALEAPRRTVTWARRMRTLSAICIALATGRRLGGLVSIQVPDLDLDRAELRVVREKAHVGRVVPVSGWCCAVAREYVEQARPLLVIGATPWLFVGADGVSAMTHGAASEALEQTMRRAVTLNPDLVELSSKRITWHSLRVSFATMLFSGGANIRSINELMLHRDLSTTARYVPIPIQDMHRVWSAAHPRP